VITGAAVMVCTELLKWFQDSGPIFMIILPSKSDSSAHFAIEHQVVQVRFSFT
jgi:hypothetical protein